MILRIYGHRRASHNRFSVSLTTRDDAMAAFSNPLEQTLLATSDSCRKTFPVKNKSVSIVPMNVVRMMLGEAPSNSHCAGWHLIDTTINGSW